MSQRASPRKRRLSITFPSEPGPSTTTLRSGGVEWNIPAGGFAQHYVPADPLFGYRGNDHQNQESLERDSPGNYDDRTDAADQEPKTNAVSELSL